MLTLRLGKDRGKTKLDWLDSWHTFSFANYYDPSHMGISALRVINDDRVKKGKGFATHYHSNMEIVSYVKKGTIKHKDSMGNIERLPAGEFQLMSAGTGITHSEYNPSLEEELEFLQIWILTNKQDVKSCYQQKKFETKDGLNLVVSSDGDKGSLIINQDMSLYHLILSPNTKQEIKINTGRTLYIHIISGEVSCGEFTLIDGDGASITNQQKIELQTKTQLDALVFDLP